MFGFVTKKEWEETINQLTRSQYECDLLQQRLKHLEDHLGLDYYHGDKNKPHYRTKRTRKTN